METPREGQVWRCTVRDNPKQYNECIVKNGSFVSIFATTRLGQLRDSNWYDDNASKAVLRYSVIDVWRRVV